MGFTNVELKYLPAKKISSSEEQLLKISMSFLKTRLKF